MDDWLSDFERVRNASPQAQWEAVKELDKALRPLEQNPKDFGVTRLEATKQRADLEAFKLTLQQQQHHCEQQHDDAEEGPPAAAVSRDDDLGYQLRDERLLQIGLLDHLVVDDDDDERRRRECCLYPEPGEYGLYAAIFALAVVILVIYIMSR